VEDEVRGHKALSLLGLLVLLFSGLLRAEELQGVQPTDTLGDIKKKFPNAQFTRVKAAWVTDEQDFFSMWGSGFPGTLYLAFTDGRPGLRKQLAEQPPPADGDASARQVREVVQGLANQSDDEALTINWVRWVPAQPIPLQRYKSKYGEPTKCDFSPDDMRPFCQWDKRALVVNLSDDQKFVLSAESSFTREEYRAAWLRTVGYLPDWLKDAAPAAPNKKPTQKGRKQ
jgi:hypothetical protein